jgi:hypothetical protein
MHFQFEFWLEKTKMPFKWSKRVYPTLNICNSMHFQRVTTNVPEFVDPFLSLSDLLVRHAATSTNSNFPATPFK